MMKINFKKALATTAAFSLGMVGLAAPAQAAPTKVTLAPVAGTNLNGLIGAGYGLKATVAGAEVAGNDVVFVVTGYATDSDVILAGGIEDTVVDFTGADVDTLVGGAMAAGAENANDDLVETVTVDNANPYGVLGLGLDDAEVSTATSLTVYAFIDSNGDEVFDADLGEIKSNSVTVKFHPADDLGVTASQKHDTVGNTTELTYKVNTINNANIFEDTLTQIADAAVYLNGLVVVDVASGNEALAANYDADEDAFVVTVASGVDTNDVVTTKLFVGEETTSVKTLRDDLADSDVDSYGAISVALTQLYADANGANWDVREGDGQVTFTMDVLDADSVGVAGQTVTWTLTDVDLADGVIRAGGKTLEAGDDPIEPTSVTDADGTASLTVTYTDLADTESFEIEAVVESSSVAAAAAKSVDAVAGDTYTVSIANAQVQADVAATDAQIAAAAEGTATVRFLLRDQFGLVPDGTFRAKINVADSVGTPLDGVAIEQWVTFSNGAASLAVKSSDEGTAVVTLAESAAAANDALQVKNAAGAWVDAGGAFDLAAVANAIEGISDIEFVDGLTAAAKVSIVDASSHDADTDAEVIMTETALSNVTLASLDTSALSNNDLGAAYAAIGAAVDGVANNNMIEVNVTDADNLAVPGASVTFSAPGVMFWDAGYDRFGNGSVTLIADSDGNVEAYFGSNTSGEHTVTVTSGSGSDTITIAIQQAAIASTDAIVLESAATYDVSKTYKFAARVVDQYGNGVALAGDGAAVGVDLLSVTYDGPGLLVGDLPNVTSATGLISFSILMGANDSGTGTITIGYDNDIAAGDEFEEEFEITLSTPAAPVADDTKVNAGSFKGYVAIYAKGHEGKRLSAKVGNDWVVVPVLASNFVRVVEYTGAGYTIAVRIYIDRVLVDTITVTTK